jgi:hypothetical protein
VGADEYPPIAISDEMQLMAGRQMYALKDCDIYRVVRVTPELSVHFALWPGEAKRTGACVHSFRKQPQQAKQP